MEPAERVVASPRLLADDNVRQSVGQTSTEQLEAQRRNSTSREQKQHMVELQHSGGQSLQLEFQDSNLSPALSLLPGGGHNITEYSLFQQSDTEFAPLRAYPDVSVASERFDFSTQDHTSHLSQHPLHLETTLSEEGASSCSLSQHSLSPGDQRKRSIIATTDERREILSVEDARSREEDSTTRSNRLFKIIGDAVEEEIYFLRKNVPAQHLLDLLQKDVSVPSSSTSSAVSSASSVKSTVMCTEEAKSKKCCKLSTDQSLVRREGPPGEASLPQQQTQPDQSQAHSSEVSNITMGSRSTQPDESSELLHRELLSEVQKSSKQQKSPTPLGQVFTPHLKEMPKGKQSHVPWTGPFSAGVERRADHREQDLWSSGNQTGIDGSYLGFLPQSQSTPGVFKAPSKSSVKAKTGHLSAIESNEENSYQSSAGVSPQLAPPVAEDHHSNTENQSQEDPTSAKVQSLPSLNYMQKVDAWRANQSSGKTSLFDSLALQGFSGISPKKKAYEAVSDTLNRILTQQARSLQQSLVSGAANSSSTTPSASSPMRGEAVGSAPSDKDNTGSAAVPSPSPFGRSQSHSSLSTVVTSLPKDQQTDTPAEKGNSQDDADNTGHPSHPLSLGQFIDVSFDQDLRLSSSQDSYKDIKLGTSVGASSGVSLDLDHYAPYWTSKLSTPPPLPKPRELNIDERIPLYLHNLGIDQSPSKILTPFAPRGPIREPEFSPTDICTIKGSTPTKSTQPSEGGSPHKGECSQSSILSVNSSMSMSVSLDSLGPAVSILEGARPTSPINAEAMHSERRLAPSSLPDEDSPSSVLKQLDSSVASTQNINKSGEDSFVSSKALLEIRKLLSQAENVISTGSSAASSSSPTAPRLLSDDDMFLSLGRKSSRLQESSFSSSSNAEDPQSHSTLLCARSSSDSMLTSDKWRQSSVGHDTRKKVQDSTVSSGAGASLVLSHSARRTEPEGCSSAPPDKVPTNPSLNNPPPAVSAQQLTSTPTDAAGVPEEETHAALGSPVQSSSSSPVTDDADQGGISDVSSESSLAIRVAKLLQNESPATMVSSTPSVTDQEESKAREWIKLKVSGQQCEPLELEKEDRERIEEIKRELLLKNPIKSQGSTDTESSATSSVRVQWGPSPPHVSSDANIQDAQPQRGLTVKLPDSSTQSAPHTDLEAKVNEIAAKEGVILSTQKPRPITSITISTCRRSTSPSPSTSPARARSPTPEPLHLTELSTRPVRPPADNRQPPSSLDEWDRVVLAQTTKQLSTTSQKRRDTVGGQLEKPLSPFQGLDQEDVNVMSKSTKALKRDSAVGHGADQATGSSTAESSARTGHVSHVHLTLSPKATDRPVTTSVHPSHADALSGQPRKEFVPLRHVSSAASSPDEGVGLSSPPEWCDAREPVRQRAPERSDTSAMFKALRPKGRTTTTVSTPHHRSEMSPRSFNAETSVPVLLPYKPHGSEEFFYVPQAEADVSSTEPSDTTMESSHTGSDDAVPPRFSSEVLGRQDSGLDRGVTIRHVEGIYSKRLKSTTLKMQEPGRRDPSATLDQSSQTVTQTPKRRSHVSTAFTREPLSSNQEAFRRDQGTSPVCFQHYDQPEPGHQTSASQTERERQSSSALDQLWHRFCDQWTTEESRPISDRETSLLERLERLSRLIHSTRAADVSAVQEDLDQNHRRRREDVPLRRKEKKDFGEAMRSVRGEVREPEPLFHRRLQVEGSSQPAEGDRRTSFSSSFSHSSSHSLHFCPAERDESEILSTTSDSMSTVDTARLVRVFGAHRVQHLKTSSSLSKLYSTINKQREGREQRRGRNGDYPDTMTPSETTGTDDSVAADSASSASTYTLPSRTLAAKKAVKVVNKGVQAGDLEIVSNGTRRHTRDVGTTFPSPSEDRALEQIISSSSPSRAPGGQRNVSKTQGTQKQRKNKRSPSKTFPEGVFWFISADDLRSEARKENQPQETWRPSAAWFEPYSKISPWREPLRQRQVHEDRNRPSSISHHAEPDPDPRTKPVSSGLARISLQEALEMRCPKFISRSQQRVRCLTLQAEERKLQAVFNRERDQLFKQPGGPAGRLPKPAGTAMLRRAVPRKEMIQRSKQIYESLPEVQRRREEERRRAEYRSYRLNAQLYNKRITNGVLGRRSAWH
ncbi:uncharacterized protein alms1 [Parambassis ranga]|uniref:Uncharacterized protein alms1 n=1 Tax=Parambassis ranga TaxID=210632 RepID=A0A6P7HQ63_9TELE|nr:Alstrom syndrome protein 1 [Parambassis ranga]